MPDTTEAGTPADESTPVIIGLPRGMTPLRVTRNSLARFLFPPTRFRMVILNRRKPLRRRIQPQKLVGRLPVTAGNYGP